MTHARCDEGYTLIEALVSLAILSGAVVMALNIFATSLNGIKRVEARQALLDQVQQQIASLSHQSDLVTGTRHGRDGNMRWTLDVTPLVGVDRYPESIMRPFRITAREVGPDGTPGRVILDTVLIRRSRP